MTIRGYAGTVPGTCGVGLFMGFANSPSYYSQGPQAALNTGGIAYAIAGFVDTIACKEVYENIKEHHKIVFQSPVKRNRNSDNRFFFVVYTRKDN